LTSPPVEVLAQIRPSGPRSIWLMNTPLPSGAPTGSKLQAPSRETWRPLKVVAKMSPFSVMR
jgi:hypothetical protein